MGRSLVSDLDLESVLRHVLEAARELTGAEYAAIGVIDESGEALERFVFVGLGEEARREIGPLPQGLGVLGELIRNPEPLRLDDVSRHPRSYGFPAKHPPMKSFLGVPVMVRGKAYGNLYLTEKYGGEQFDATDEDLLVVLAQWAAVAIDNARLYEGAERRRRELERAVRGLEATASLSRELGGETDLEWVLALIARRGRALIDCGAMLVLLADQGRLRVAEAAGELPGDLEGLSIPVESSVVGEVFRDGEVARYTSEERGPCGDLGLEPASALIVPLSFRGGAEGLLVALGPLDRQRFDSDDELLIRSFATSAATAIATAQRVERQKVSLAIEASEAERGRWARELHDETLQELGALRVMHESALNRGDAGVTEELTKRAIDQLDQTIASLEGLITELRPASLDHLGVGPALDNLIDHLGERTALHLEKDIQLSEDAGGSSDRLAPEVEATIYRIVQEALNNVIKHAEASQAEVRVVEEDECVTVVVRDDGRGFEAGKNPERFGLVGMRERVDLGGGTLEISSEPGAGTQVTARVPARRR